MTRDENQKRTIKRNIQRLAAFRSSIDPNITVQAAQTFLVVAEHPGMGVVEMAQLTGATKATMSRHLLDLSDRLRNGEEGYGLLRRVQDPNNLRSVSYAVTPKGQLLLNALIALEEKD